MRRAWFVLLALSIGLNAGLLYGKYVKLEQARPNAPAGHRPMPAPGMSPPSPDHLLREHLERMTTQLHLDPDQEERLRTIHEDLLPRIVARRRDVGETRRRMAEQYGSIGLDPEQFRALALRVGADQAVLDSLVVEAMLGEAAILTPEQRERYARRMPWGRRGLPPPPPR